MQRLLYSPKAYVYTKDQNGTVYNLANYVTAGQVDRKISQVSSAQITLRNPYKLFTGGQGQPRAFHPMDPITIYLQRISGYPVRVFTGYLDSTPYYQMYPGTITLQASCTLKKLLYTFFDPSLPYVIAFFEKYGWINTGSGSIISSKAFGNQITNQAAVNAGQKPFTDLQDGSLGKLLWAILFDIGEWQDSHIYVENLPSGANGIASRMQALMKSIQTDQEQASQDFTSFLNAVIGSSSQGSGGGTAGGGSTFSGGPLASANGLTIKGSPMNPNQLGFANEILKIGKRLGASPTGVAVVLTQAIAESTMGDPSAMGWDAQNPTYGGLLAGSQANFGSLGAPGSSAVTDAEISAAFTGSGDKGYQYPGGLLTLTASANVGSIAMQNSGSGSQYITEAQQEGQTLDQWVQEAKAIVSASNGSQSTTNSTQSTSTQSGATAPPSTTATSGGNTTVIDAIISAASTINNARFPYSWGGGHEHAGTPSSHPPNSDGSGTPVLGYDCSGSVGAVLSAANGACGIKPGDPVDGSNNVPAQANAIPGPAGGIPEVTLFANPTHIYMRINGKFWGTWAGGAVEGGAGGAAGSGGSWQADGTVMSGYQQYHIPLNVLNSSTTYALPSQNGASASGLPGGAGGTGTGAAGSVSSTSTAQAFVAELQFPSVEDQVTAIALGSEHKGLMHDQSLMPFVQQVAQASLRSFQSLPNGDFYAFYPDYFGEMGHHKPYWLIDDLEIMSGGIDITDDALATHVFAVGDNTWPVNNELMNMLFSAGAINIFNAFVTTGMIGGTDGSQQTIKKNAKYDGGLSPGVMNAEEAVQFIKRYGARPLVQNYPMVRSPIFEMLMAYQQFMFAWSNQFKTPFTFTFMPELYPGGKVGFPNHGIQMYINEVSHSWDYTEGGFTTTAQLSAPSILDGVNPNDYPDLPPLMVQALIEPIKQVIQTTTPTPKQQTPQEGLSQLETIIQQTQANAPGPNAPNNPNPIIANPNPFAPFRG